MYTETATLTPAQADKLRSTLDFGEIGRANFDGRSIADCGDGTFSVYGSNETRRKFRQLIRGIQYGDGRLATEKQISYLKYLISRDPAGAIAIGASPDGTRVTPELGLREAAALIGQLIDGV